jgi:ribosomal-protein-alanine N-acetyltransferase
VAVEVQKRAQPLITTATRADIDAVEFVARRSFPAPWPRSAFEEELYRPWAIIRVLRPASAEEICGFCHFWLVADEVQVHHLAVVSEMRRLGHGRALLQDLVAIARHRGVKEVWLEVRRSNQAALNLYYSAGFECAGVRAGYYADNGEDAIVAKLVI